MERLSKLSRGRIFIYLGIFGLFFNKISTPAQKVLDDSEESNIIPLSAIPNLHGNSASNRQPQPDNANDLSLTVLNLQKDAKNKQNFKGFVDSDKLDEKPLPFIPTRAPVTTTQRSV